MNTKKRKTDDEEAIPPMRSDRFFAINGEWYFRTREGKDFGPYTTKYEANSSLDDYIVYMKLQASKRLVVHKTYF